MATCAKCGGNPFGRRRARPAGDVELHWVCDGCWTGMKLHGFERDPFDFQDLTYHLILPVLLAVALAVIAGLMLT